MKHLLGLEQLKMRLCITLLDIEESQMRDLGQVYYWGEDASTAANLKKYEAANLVDGSLNYIPEQVRQISILNLYTLEDVFRRCFAFKNFASTLYL